MFCVRVRPDMRRASRLPAVKAVASKLKIPQINTRAPGPSPRMRAMELDFAFWLLLLYGIFLAMGIWLAVRALLWARTAQGATAWAVALLTVPFLAVPAYAVFGGHRFQGYVNRRRNSDHKLKKEWDEFDSWFVRARCFNGERKPAIEAFESIANIPFTAARSVRLLENGDAFFPELKKALLGAERFIDFQFYVFRDDGIGAEIAGILEEKAKQGVQVRILYDSIGSQESSRKFFERIRASGAKVEAFVSTRWRLKSFRFQINFRNHRKLVNIDNRLLFVGGMNVGDDYLSKNEEIGFWRDTHAVIEGSPAVQAGHSFLADWYWSTGEVIDFDSKGLEPSGEIPVLILATSPTGIREAGSLAMLNAISSARKRLWIATPYFVPDEQIVSALQLAALRGVEIKILIAGRTDQKLARLAARTFLDELIPCGIQIFEYQGGFMHQKVVLVDEELAHVGSTNFDNRSFRLNFEIGAWVVDRNFGSQVESMLRRDLAASKEIELRELKSMPFSEQIACGFARLLAPIL